MNKLNRTTLVVIIILAITTTTLAHGGNITGWKEQSSDKIINYNDKYYGYHNKDGIRHYHEVKWSEEKQKWEIVDSNRYYNNELKETTFEELSKNEQESEIAEVEFVEGVDGDTAKFRLKRRTNYCKIFSN